MGGRDKFLRGVASRPVVVYNELRGVVRGRNVTWIVLSIQALYRTA